MKSRSKTLFLKKANSLQKLGISVIFAIIISFLFRSPSLPALTHAMIGWDAFALSTIILHWITFYITDSHDIRKQAGKQDSRGSLLFFIILFATIAALLAVLLLILSKKEAQDVPLQIPVAILGMLLSWMLIHTIFAIRYAHIFYGDHPSKKDTHAGGLEFPEEEKPDFLDFAYFGFVLGMTFQVSDVQITSRRIRRLAMYHGFISFIYATIMIALTINVIA